MRKRPACRKMILCFYVLLGLPSDTSQKHRLACQNTVLQSVLSKFPNVIAHPQSKRSCRVLADQICWANPRLQLRAEPYHGPDDTSGMRWGCRWGRIASTVHHWECHGSCVRASKSSSPFIIRGMWQETQRLVWLAAALVRASLGPPLKTGHFYFAGNRTFLLCLGKNKGEP
jgi:hypothetical protein